MAKITEEVIIDDHLITTETVVDIQQVRHLFSYSKRDSDMQPQRKFTGIIHWTLLP
jgi:hypothetical protein